MSDALLFPQSERSRALDAKLAAFMQTKVIPAEAQFTAWDADPTTRWLHPERDRAAVLALASAWLEQPCPAPISTSSSPSRL